MTTAPQTIEAHGLIGQPPSDFWRETSYQRFPGGYKKLAVLAEIILRKFAARPRVLDVGCGNGSLAFPLAVLRCDVVGVDVDGDSIERCTKRNRFPNARFVHTDGTLAEVDGAFDLIVCSEVLEHLVEPRPLVAAMRDKLAPAGLVFVTIPNGYGLREIGGRIEQFLRRRCGLDRLLVGLRRVLGRTGMPSAEEKYEMHTSNPDQGHVQKFTRRAIVDLLEAEGLEVSDWQNSFVILSVFHCRSGASFVERLDSWAADHLPAACASGWFLTVARRDESAGISRAACRSASPSRRD
ncbi:MAG TPA: class I SAM-dependent methyltransferase [Candidatus Binatia bacterium]|nr:class I SAM-dependent methyltransferase [Candidatus Binatia bacterium]